MQGEKQQAMEYRLVFPEINLTRRQAHNPRGYYFALEHLILTYILGRLNNAYYPTDGRGKRGKCVFSEKPLDLRGDAKELAEGEERAKDDER